MEHSSATSDEPIKLPAWTPRCLVPTIRWLTSQPMGDDHAEILIRLLTDPRMQWVWDELSRLDPNTGDYLHPARPPPYAPPRSRHASQAAAMGETLHFAFCSARDGRHVTKAEEVDLARAGLLREAAALRKVNLPYHDYEFNSALVRAIDTEDAERSWLSGQDIFSDVLREPGDLFSDTHAQRLYEYAFP